MAFEDLLVQLSSKLDESGFKQLDRLESNAMKKTSILSSSLKKMFVGVLGTFAVKSIMDATVKMDTLTRTMEALAGSKAGGQSQLTFLKEEADRLGQSFTTVADSYKNLFAAGTGAGWNPDEIQQVFSSVLEAGTVLGSSKQQIGSAIVALEQMISKGKVSTQELKLQLGNALPGAMQLAAKAMGVTSEELDKMISKGIKSEEFVKRFAATLHEEYGENATATAHTLRAELERLGNAIFFLQTSILEGDNVDGIAEAVREITKLISSPAFTQSLNAIGKLVAFLAKNLKLVIGITVIIGLRRIWQQLILLRLELLTTTFAAGSLGAAMQMIVSGQVINGLKSISGIFKAWLVPLLKIAAILGIIIELYDTLTGKDTASSEIARNLPTGKDLVNSDKFQNTVVKGWHQFKNQIRPFWAEETPTLYEDGNVGSKYNKDGTLKNGTANNNISANNNITNETQRTANNNATIIINANSADSQQVANLVKATVSDMFNQYEEVYT